MAIPKRTFGFSILIVTCVVFAMGALWLVEQCRTDCMSTYPKGHIEVVMVDVPLRKGQQLQLSNIVTELVPEQSVTPNALMAGELKTTLGRRAVKDLEKGDLIRHSDFEPAK